jgi:hypothetical protein
MTIDVVAHCRGDNKATFIAELAQRERGQLLLANALPSCCAIELRKGAATWLTNYHRYLSKNSPSGLRTRLPLP